MRPEDGVVPAAAERNSGRRNLPVRAVMRDVSAFLRARHQLQAQCSEHVSRVTAAHVSHRGILASNLRLSGSGSGRNSAKDVSIKSHQTAGGNG